MRKRLIRALAIFVMCAAALTVAGVPSMAIDALAAHPAPMNPLDCKGEPPLPHMPDPGMGSTPDAVPGDPFASGNTSNTLAGTYGTEFKWWAFDNGCGPGRDVLPNMGASLGGLLGMSFPGWIMRTAEGVFGAIVSPSSWTAGFDAVVDSLTYDVKTSVWDNWVPIALLLVGVVIMWRARTGNTGAVVTAFGWACTVMAVCAFLFSYPSESVRMVDDGVSSTVSTIAETMDGFSDHHDAAAKPGEGGTPRSDNHVAMLFDKQNRETIYHTWLEGVFGNAETETAKKFGPQVFKATHMSYAEAETYRKDAPGEGVKIIDKKKEEFKKVAEEIKKSDPQAYDHFTGNQWGSRIGLAALSALVVGIAGMFLLGAGIASFIGYIIIRILVPFSPAIGVCFFLPALMPMALAYVKRVVRPIIMGPLTFAGALIILRINGGIMSADLAYWLKVILIVATAIVGWIILRPITVRMPSLSTLYYGSRMLGRFMPRPKGWQMPQMQRGGRHRADSGAGSAEDTRRGHRVVWATVVPNQRTTRPQSLGGGRAALGGTSQARTGTVVPSTVVHRTAGDFGHDTHAPESRGSVYLPAGGSGGRRVAIAATPHSSTTATTGTTGAAGAAPTGPVAPPPSKPQGPRPAGGAGTRRVHGPQASEGTTASARPAPLVHETHVTIDQSGRRVFQVYTPQISTAKQQGEQL